RNDRRSRAMCAAPSPAASARCRWPAARPCSRNARKRPSGQRRHAGESRRRRSPGSSFREAAKRLPRAIAVRFCALARPSRDGLPRTDPRAVNEQRGGLCLVTHVTAGLFFAAAHFQSTLRVERAMEEHTAPGTHGLVLHWAARYDLLAWLLTHGRERELREAIIRLAELQTGSDVLDVGCGTGTLAIAATRHVGTKGTVIGIDASPSMIARANRKAEKAGAATSFHVAVAENLPFPGRQF